MVNRAVKERKDVCEYSLPGVLRIVGFKQVVYATRRVQRHVDNLKFDHDDVCAVLANLEASDFRHSESYEDDDRYHDVYRAPHPYDDQSEPLYIKFRIDDDCVYLDLCSFHPDGWI